MNAASATITHSSRTKLNCEELESRSNPSNLLAVLNSANDLIVYGGNAGSEIVLEENMAGDYYVMGINGTTLDGRSVVNFGVIHPTNVLIEMTGGNNQIQVIGIHATGTFAILTGNGNDYVNMSGVDADRVGVNLQGGNNTLKTTLVVAQIGANFVAGSGTSVWYDDDVLVGQYLMHSGWSQILT